MNAKIVPFDELAGADLIVDAVYLGGVAKNAADDPLNILTRCGNMGGFRKVGRKQQTKYVVLPRVQNHRVSVKELLGGAQDETQLARVGAMSRLYDRFRAFGQSGAG